MTREPDLYKNIYQTKFRSDKIQNYHKFGVLIGNAKNDPKSKVPPGSTTDTISQKYI